MTLGNDIQSLITRLRFIGTMVLSMAMALSLACGGGGGGVDDDDDDGDPNPPGAVTDLTVTGVTPHTASLRWTSPAMDDGEGMAFEYDLRLAGEPITDQSWQGAMQVPDEPAPLPAGMIQTMTVLGLTPESTVHFALKSRDDLGSWSPLSNPATAVLPAETDVIFPDPALEAVIRDLINKPAGPIYPDDLTDIDMIEAESLGIVDLTGLASCPAVWRLNLTSNSISDLSPLVGMASLHTLGVGNNMISDLTPLGQIPTLRFVGVGQNQIDDLSPLAAIGDLEALSCAENQVSDLTPLAGLIHLHYLYMNGNQIADLAPLAGLSALDELYASVNDITDLTPLQDLPLLKYIFLEYNAISDLAPLVANPGVGVGDTIRLIGNPLSPDAIDEQIPALEAKGAVVIW